MRAILPLRKSDAYGAGHYGATRGSRKHRGIDYLCTAGSHIFAPVTGKVTKLGWPYKDDLSFRYVEVTTNDGIRSRTFYVDPIVDIGQEVSTSSILGRSQDLTKRYPKDDKHATCIPNHVHHECKNGANEYLNPEECV